VEVMTINPQQLGTQLTVFNENKLGVIIYLKNSETISINGPFSFQINESINGPFSFQINELTLSIKMDNDVWMIDIGDISYIHSRLLPES
jgi:hypothetical protein